MFTYYPTTLRITGTNESLTIPSVKDYIQLLDWRGAILFLLVPPQLKVEIKLCTKRCIYIHQDTETVILQQFHTYIEKQQFHIHTYTTLCVTTPSFLYFANQFLIFCVSWPIKYWLLLYSLISPIYGKFNWALNYHRDKAVGQRWLEQVKSTTVFQPLSLSMQQLAELSFKESTFGNGFISRWNSLPLSVNCWLDDSAFHSRLCQLTEAWPTSRLTDNNQDMTPGHCSMTNQ